MSRCNNQLNNSGLSLVEAILAMTVLLVGVLSIINIFPSVLKISKNAQQETIAANLAQAEIENMFQLGYDNIAIGTIEAKHRLSGNSANPFYQYQRQTISSYVDADMATSTLATGLKKITTIVYWSSPHFNQEKSIAISVLISQK